MASAHTMMKTGLASLLNVAALACLVGLGCARVGHHQHALEAAHSQAQLVATSQERAMVAAEAETGVGALHQFSFRRTAYAMVSGVGVGASYNVRGNCVVGTGSATCFASGQSAPRVTRRWQGTVKFYEGSSVIGTCSLRPLRRASFTDATRETIGSCDVNLGSEVPTSFKVQASYVIDTGHGMSVPMGQLHTWHVVTL